MSLRINYFITSYLLFCHCGVFSLKAPIYCFYIIMLHLLYTGGIMFSEPIYCFENKFFHYALSVPSRFIYQSVVGKCSSIPCLFIIKAPFLFYFFLGETSRFLCPVRKHTCTKKAVFLHRSAQNTALGDLMKLLLRFSSDGLTNSRSWAVLIMYVLKTL